MPAATNGTRVSDFTTFREGSLHAALKARYAATVIEGRVEADVDGFVVDVAGRDELVEIQTAGFASLRRKLERLLVSHRVVLVHPIPIEKWLVRVDADGVILARRRSPKRGLGLDLFDELVHIPALVTDPCFRIDLLLVREEEIRGPIPVGARFRYPREWWRLDRRLIEVVETRRIDGAADLLGLLHDRGHRRSKRTLQTAGDAHRLLPRAIGRDPQAGSPRAAHDVRASSPHRARLTLRYAGSVLTSRTTRSSGGISGSGASVRSNSISSTTSPAGCSNTSSSSVFQA